MWPMTSCVCPFCSSWIGSHMCKVSPQSFQPFQRRFKKKKKDIVAESRGRLRHQNFMVDPFLFPDDTQTFFIPIGCSVLHTQLWRDNEGTYDIIKNHTHSPWGVLSLCQVSIFFLGAVFGDGGPNFSVFPIWLQHHVTYDIIIIFITCFMSSRNNVENFVSIRQAVVERNTKVLCGQTNRQTDRQTNKQEDVMHHMILAKSKKQIWPPK